jgi:TPR repeat protein
MCRKKMAHIPGLQRVRVGKDTKQGIRWLSLAANKGQYQAQAALGA